MGSPIPNTPCIFSKVHVHVSLGHVPRITGPYNMQSSAFVKNADDLLNHTCANGIGLVREVRRLFIAL